MEVHHNNYIEADGIIPLFLARPLRPQLLALLAQALLAAPPPPQRGPVVRPSGLLHARPRRHCPVAAGLGNRGVPGVEALHAAGAGGDLLEPAPAQELRQVRSGYSRGPGGLPEVPQPRRTPLRRTPRTTQIYDVQTVSRDYRQHFSQAYKVLYKEGELSYLTEILDSAQEGRSGDMQGSRTCGSTARSTPSRRTSSTTAADS